MEIKTKGKYNAYVLSNDADCLLISMRLCSKYKDLNIKIFDKILYDINSINKKICNIENPSLETGTKSSDLIHTISIILIACYGCDFSTRIFYPTEDSIKYLIDLLGAKEYNIYTTDGLSLEALYNFLKQLDVTVGLENAKMEYYYNENINPVCVNMGQCVYFYLLSLKYADNFFSLKEEDLITTYVTADKEKEYRITENTTPLDLNFSFIKYEEYKDFFGKIIEPTVSEEIQLVSNNLFRSVYTDTLVSISDVYNIKENIKFPKFYGRSICYDNKFQFIEPVPDENVNIPPHLNLNYLEELSNFYANEYPELIK